MDIFQQAGIGGERAGAGRLRPGVRLWVGALAAAALLAAGPPGLFAQAPPAGQPPPPPQAPAAELAPPPDDASPMPTTYTPQSPEQLEQLVAPIALYPDSLVAEILAAATFPEQVVEADRWLQANPGLTGEALAQAANQQPWDASVKALTAFPPVLGNMDRNLSWTSSLGDAYYNQPQDVMAAVQTMRQRAQAAGNLQSTPQQVVSTEGSDIEIAPASPDVVYVPAYDPWLIYGAPLIAWPGWFAYPGIWFAGPYLSFGLGIPIGFFEGFGWGWPHWGCDWGRHFVRFNRREYVSRSATFFNRRNFYQGVGARGAFRAGGNAARSFNNRAAAPRIGAARPFGGDERAARGYAAPRAEPRSEAGMRSGAFSGFSSGGETRGFSARGRASFGGGGFPAGGGAPRGGGGFGGGGPRR